MAKKVFASKNLDMKSVLVALESRNMIRLKPPVRQTNKTAWEALVGALLHKRCDLLVMIVDEGGKRYERVRGTSTNAKITRQMGLAAIEYVLRPTAETPKWAKETS